MIQLTFDISKVMALRAAIELRTNSPWDGYVVRHYVLLSDGREWPISADEMFSILNELRKTDARLSDSSEGLSRVARVVYQ